MAHKTWAIHYTTEHVELIRTDVRANEEIALVQFWLNHEDDPARIANVTAHHVNTVEDR